ncbi:MAG: SH3 domain-containing C40 family peptidase, partial [Calditrichota bacterium]
MKGVRVFSEDLNSHKLINVGVANIYAKASFLSSVVTQGILGESVTMLAQEDNWVRIRQWDGYEGWIYHFSLVDVPNGWKPTYAYPGTTGLIYQEPSTDSFPVRQICAGVQLPGTRRDDQWITVQLPDGGQGYLPREPEKPSSGNIRQDIMVTAERFLGTSYLWGGKTGFGFDCSGFVQTIFWLNGIPLPRDASQQAGYAHQLTGRGELQPGDLVFFTTDRRIDHVGIVYDPDRFIHCSGWVRQNSFEESAGDYNRRLDTIFSAAGRVIQ